ncbi:MAG: hydantoinase/oxoprolinase family protein [Deltaproteobacteria bacterium]|nr:hydantoinase/oxoprolinase family protein [Deltaproteobacteria bacterium]
MSERCVLGADIGVTFTDIVLTRGDGQLHVVKQLTTPGAPEESVLGGIRRLLETTGVDPASIERVVHGTPLATNAVIEHKGARVAFVTTKGFGDLLRISREARVEDDRYDLFFEPSPPVLERDAVFEIVERCDARGEVLVGFDATQARAEAARIARYAPEAVAVCFLHSYARPDHEEAMEAILHAAMPDVRVILSSRVHAEMREFDRASTTLHTAQVAPLMARYLARLREGLGRLGIQGPLHIMESSGGVMSAAVAAERAVATLESGGAAGVMAAARFANHYGEKRVISFDMGGTTAKAGVVHDGRPRVVRELHVGGRGSYGGRRAGTGMPIKTPTIDLAEVGAGGGSIAWLDPEGVLQVGPRSSGADPGPACYARGGEAPTVTDANLVLGYLTPERFAGGTMALDPARAHAAIAKSIAEPLGTSVVRAAWSIHEMANANMASAVHVVTVQQGIDPRDHVLICFGGAGPMHAAGLASRFGLSHIVAPPEAGVASAIGMQATDLTAEHGHTHWIQAADLTVAELSRQFARALEVAREKMGLDDDEASLAGALEVERLVDARFVGQSHELSIPYAPAPGQEAAELAALPARFRARYRELYGIESTGAVEYAAFRVRLRIPVARPPLRRSAREGTDAPAAEWRDVWFGADKASRTRILTRGDLAQTGTLSGPLLVESDVDTVVVPPGWSATVDEVGSVHLRRE